MKKTFEKLIGLSNSLTPQKQKLFIDLLEKVGNELTFLSLKLESSKEQIAGVKKKTYTDNLVKSIALLKLLGFSEFTFEGINSDFLNWMFENTVTNTKYNPKLMNYYLLTTMQQAYFICLSENQGGQPNYNQIRKTMLTFGETIEEYENELKLSLPELINKIDGKN